MIFGIEVMLTLLGLWMLCTGKSWGKNPIKHWQFRLMGGLLLTLFPLVMVVAFLAGVVAAVNNPGLDLVQLEASLHWPIIWFNVGAVIVYAIAALTWDARIRKKVMAQTPAEPPELFTP